MSQIEPKIAFTPGSGSREITEEWVIQTSKDTLMMMDDTLQQSAEELGLEVRVRRDNLRRTIRFIWSPAQDARDIGIWVVQ